MYYRLIYVLILGILALASSGCLETKTSVETSISLPETYYYSQKPADVNSPIELIRFASTIRAYAKDFTVPEKAAFFEWFLKNRGFDISFAYSDNFDNTGEEHVWLLVKNKLGEVMVVEPSYIEMRTDSICPTTSRYKNYQKQFKDINELSENTGGLDKYAWWTKVSGQEYLNKDILLLKKSQLSN